MMTRQHALFPLSRPSAVWLSAAAPLVAGCLAVVPPALAADPPQKIMSLVVYGEDPCPTDAGNPDEIVVCARRPESERYRIPKKLREKPEPVGGPGWASQVASMEENARALMPGSCSVNGSYGFSGCTAALLRQWFAEKRMQESSGTP